MHTRSIEKWRHDHVFLGADHRRNERRTWAVIALTASMMVAEIVAGTVFGSMALLADGIHMATHAGALIIAALAYLYARRHAHDRRFGFGTAKVGDLAGFASAVILAMFALMIGYELLVRLAAPVPIRFNEAIAVAVLGLVVNLLSAWLLHQGEDHGQHHHGHEPHAYLHDNEDAVPSITLPTGATTISVPRISTSWPMLSPRCLQSRGCSPGARTGGSGWTRSWASSERS